MELEMKTEFTVPQWVFVYGTLKQGYGNNQRCLAESQFIGEAVSVEANFEMRRVGFPIIWQVAKGGAKVTGEIFRASPQDMERCDRLEGHPRMYKREQRLFTLTGAPVRSVSAWVYLWQGTTHGEKIEPVDGKLTWTAEPLPLHFIEHDDDPIDVDDDEEAFDDFWEEDQAE